MDEEEDELLSLNSNSNQEFATEEDFPQGESCGESESNLNSVERFPQLGEDITLSDEEDNDNQPRNATSSPGNVPISETVSRYGLRRKRKINYAEVENGCDSEALNPTTSEQKRMKKEVFDVFSFASAKISKWIQKPELIDHYTKCKIVFMDGTDSDKLELVSKLFEKCGQQFEEIFIRIRYNVENFPFLKTVLKAMTAVGKISYRYHNSEDGYQFLQLLKKLTESSSLQTLNSLKLVSISGAEALWERHLEVLSTMKTPFNNLELGDALWEDVKSTTLEKILSNCKSSLETLIIHGGFRGDAEKERKLINFPKMETLSKLRICPNYGFLSEIKNPYSKKARMITLGDKKEEPFKIAIKFQPDLPNLQHVVLGNLIEVEDLLFSAVRKLIEFRCGSYWNLSIRFPLEGSRKALMESAVTDLQFPDALKDPSFPVKVAKYFPNLKKVWMFLPSVPVLRAFFKAFENSDLQELYLKTQFDFESTMESCLLPRMSDVLRKSPATETLLQTLKEYKHFDEYVKYYNVELPVEMEDLMEGHSAGIRALKNLRILHIEHIPRKLLIPIADDERKWYDHNCKFMSTTFGYERYPLNYRCHKEILQLNLSEYIWRNIQINTAFTEEFYDAGFVDIPNDYVVRDEYTNDNEEEDLFIPVQKKSLGGTQVKIMPSMLLPNIKVKPEAS